MSKTSAVGFGITVRVRDGDLALARGAAPDADAIVDVDPGSLYSIVTRGATLDAAMLRGGLKLGGYRSKLERLVAAVAISSPPRGFLCDGPLVSVPAR
jgi:alkyl sulfatase BDS1-like metallo-beta-lactamase superfamily hydrolase